MKLKTLVMLAGCMGLVSGIAADSEAVYYHFNDFSEGLINGQNNWKTLRKIPGEAAVSVYDELGPSGEVGDKALVIQLSDEVSHVVNPDGMRWMPGQTLTMNFDFRIGINSQELAANKPVLTVFLGNAYLSQKARWEIRLEAAPDGTWTLGGGLPVWKEMSGIVAESVLERPDTESSAISSWMHFSLITTKLDTPDSFESIVEIRNDQGEVIADLHFFDTLNDKKTAAVWDLSRVHFGFDAPLRQFGLVCIDNVEFASYE